MLLPSTKEASPLHPNLSSLFKGLSVALFLLFGALFLMVPTQSFHALTGGFAIVLDKYFWFVLLGCLVTSLFSYWLSCVLCTSEHRSSAPVQVIPSSKAAWILWFQIGISLFVFGVAVSQLSTPFDVDELQQSVYTLERSFWSSILPFRDDIHSLAHFGSIVSMKIFGVSKESIRYPALFFLLGFLGTLFYFSYRFLSGFTTVLIYSHLATNQFLVWYFHSARGYISSLWVTLVAFMVLYSLTKGDRLGSSKGGLFLFCLALCLSIFTHPFSAVACGVFLMALLHWLYENRQSLTREQRVAGIAFLSSGFVVLPFFAFCFVKIAQRLTTNGDLHAEEITFWLSNPAMLLGLGRIWALKLVLGLTVGILGWLWVRHRLKFSFSWLVVGYALGFFTSVFFLLHVHHLEPRWFLAFLLPCLIALSDTVSSLPSKVRIPLKVALLAVLVGLPLVHGREIFDSRVMPYAAYDQFLSEVKLKTTPIERNCYYFPEKNANVQRAEALFFFDSPKTPAQRLQCLRHFTLFFGEGEVTGKPLQPLREVFRMAPNFALYEGRHSTRTGNENKLFRVP